MYYLWQPHYALGLWPTLRQVAQLARLGHKLQNYSSSLQKGPARIPAKHPLAKSSRHASPSGNMDFLATDVGADDYPLVTDYPTYYPSSTIGI